MKFYHGTSQENWEQIQKEGVLFGRQFVGNKEYPRRTYLAVDIEEARCYGNIVLEVEYNPHKHKKMNNYCEDCWQLRVYEPITIDNIKLVENNS
jgi:carboxylesterase type B